MRISRLAANTEGPPVAFALPPCGCCGKVLLVLADDRSTALCEAGSELVGGLLRGTALGLFAARLGRRLREEDRLSHEGPMRRPRPWFIDEA